MPETEYSSHPERMQLLHPLRSTTGGYQFQYPPVLYSIISAVSHHVGPPSQTTIPLHRIVQSFLYLPTMSDHHVKNESHHIVQIPRHFLPSEALFFCYSDAFLRNIQYNVPQITIAARLTN